MNEDAMAPRKRALARAAFTLILLLACSCNHGRPCLDVSAFLQIAFHYGIGEAYGATDINAVSGNQALSVAFNKEGTITVFKWPNPSYYDQVKYMTTQRDKERMGALENEGVFAGVYYETDEGPGFSWLREFEVGQRFPDPASVVVETVFESKGLGLRLTQLDLVEPDADALWRHYRIEKSPGSPARSARLVVYAHFAPAVSKMSRLPITDWCLDSSADSSLDWSSGDELFVQARKGRDVSTGRPSSVALAFGLDRPSSSHQAGYDSRCPLRQFPRDPFALAPEGVFPGADSARGKVSAGLTYDFNLDAAAGDSVSFIVAAAADESRSRELIASSRNKGFHRARLETDRHWHELLARAPLPATDNKRILEVAQRSLVILLLGYGKDTDTMVASISTQPPYGEDWPRDGSYLNEALLAAGFDDLVRRHNLFYARVQSQPGNRVSHVPEGNWAANYYADGVPGFPVLWWEIDETAYGIWGLYRYYEHSSDRSYLEEVYPAIKRAADFLVDFRDPRTGLPRPAYENDVFFKSQTLRGALCVYFGMKSAVRAAAALGDEPSRNKWQGREQELEQLIFTKFYDPDCRRFVPIEKNKGDCSLPGAGFDQALLLWPGGLVDYQDPRALEAGQDLWKYLAPSFAGEKERGLYEPYGMLSLARLWKSDPEKLALVQDALLWEATVPITDTGLIGEIWVRDHGGVYTGQSQPQLWHHALFYMAALEAFGPRNPAAPAPAGPEIGRGDL